ncbi:BspA family leucine-rich repeat surface protein [Croceitalea vernalis]|uniref:BspA family leucine-rich repeat surface protein n=1 Tax=Croceitalea vernalis TaxID=3075599 RepID=A0ABU3BKB7_9FLAO|nr:BspA family leucine-rich repeat surface protein [Croceitalea sp. P007]MDT0622608.1 BspA family leucine-rich repeat surface protein [Croceitalea sp. P007]
MKKRLLFVALAFSLIIQAQTNSNQRGSKTMTVTYLGTSPKLTEIKPISSFPEKARFEDGVYVVPNKLSKSGVIDRIENPISDPVIQNSNAPLFNGAAVKVGFDGGSNQDNAIVNGIQVAPPDTQGDVGPNHYIQMTNSVTTIFDKSGNTVFGPSPNSVFFQNLDPRLAGTNDGDPVVVYDQFEDRWIVSQFAISAGAPYFMLVAVSQTGDPLGAYNQYAIDYGNDFPDYPKLGVWNDALFITTRDFENGSSFAGFSIVAIDKFDMYSGIETNAQRFEIDNPDFDGILPADADGNIPPPAGEPHYSLYLSASGNLLNLVTTAIDFDTPENSTLIFSTIPVAAYSFFQSQVSQPNGQTLDALPFFLMYRLQYMNFGTHASMLTNHTVQQESGGTFGIRWYEFRKTATPWSVYQQGTYLPDDNLNRWMGSIAMNGEGDIALGYSVAGSTLNPSIRFVGQTSDQSGTGSLNVAETSILEGTLSSRGTNRWGDYAMMSIDPVDGDFWFTQEYVKNDLSFSGWGTYISEFAFGNPPIALCQDIAISLDETGIATITPDQIDNGSIDFNGGAVTLSLDIDTFDCSNLGENMVNLIVTGSEGIPASCSARVVVLDNIAPIAVCQDIAIRVNSTEPTEITFEQVDGGSTDNCGINNATFSKSTFSIADIGENIIDVTVSDANGNTSVCQSTITVIDEAEIGPPIAVCQDLVIQLDSSGNASITPQQVDNGSLDAIGGAVDLALDTTTFNCSNLGLNTVALTVTDAGGLTDICTATVTVEDNLPPSVECQNIAVNLDAEGVATITPEELIRTGGGEILGLFPWASSSPNTLFTFEYDSTTDDISIKDNPFGSLPGNNISIAQNPVDNQIYVLLDAGAAQAQNIDRALYPFDMASRTVGNKITSIVSVGGQTTPNAMDFDSDGNLYVVFKNGEVNKFDLLTGTASAFAQVSLNKAMGLTYDDDQNRLIYVAQSASGATTNLFEIDLQGNVNLLFELISPCGSTGQAMDYVGGGKLLASGTFGCNRIFTIDLNNQSIETIISPLGINAPVGNLKDILFLPQGIADNCQIADISLSQSSFTIDDLGENIVTVTVTDTSGNSASCEAIVTITETAPFVTTWNTSIPDESDDRTIVIPTFDGEDYNYSVNWGDGQIETGLTGDATHIYDVSGTYQVSISGDFPRIYFAGIGDNSKIVSVDQWGEIQWTSMEDAFNGCNNLDVVATDVPDLSQVTNLSRMLAGCNSLVGNTTFNDWDVSTITKMNAFFSQANSFTQDLDKWNVSNVEEMSGMFFVNTGFNGNIGTWDVSNVRAMNQMFQNATAFNQDLNNWNTGSVTDMQLMFADATAFNGDITNWNTSNVFFTFGMFENAIVFNRDISSWDVSNVSTMFSMFESATSFDQDLSAWDISSIFQQTPETGMASMFLNAGISQTNYDNTLIGWATLSDSESQIPLDVVFDGGNSQFCLSELARQNLIDSFGWTITDGGITADCERPFVTTWKTDNEGVSADNQITIPTFPGETYNYTVDWGDGSNTENVVGNITHTYDEPGTYVVSIWGDFPRFFFTEAADLQKISNINQWGDLIWSSFDGMFVNCSNLDISAIDIPILTEVESFRAAFFGCSNLIWNQTVGNWDMSNAVNLSAMFSNATVFNQDINTWNLENVETINDMFNGATFFNQSLSNWKFPKVNSLNSLFQDASSFNQDISGWDLSNISDIGELFFGASSFNQDIGGWNVENVISMFGTFYDAISFNQDLNDWNVSKVRDMNYMFKGANTFNGKIGSWQVSELVAFGWSFQGASSFNQDLSQWKITNVIDMRGLFDESGLSNENYDETLISWSQLPSLQNQVQLDAPNNEYCLSEAARRNIIDTYGWTINDGGKAANCIETECTTFSNIALGKTAIQSTTYGDGVASIAIDGNTFGDSPWTADATLQHTISGEFQPWWQVDLGETSAIKGITIFNRTDKLLARLNNFYILISETPFNETATLSELLVDDTILNYFFEGEAGLEENFDFDANGRYVRIQLSGTGTLHMAEVEVLGCAVEAVQRPFVTTWKTDNMGLLEDNQVTIPTFPGETYNYTVDWGDGTTTENVTGDITHTYSSSGTYTVSISGDFPRIYLSSSISNAQKLLTIEQWGDIVWSSMEEAFYASDPNITASDVPNLTNVTSLKSMFYACPGLRNENLSMNNWDVSGIEDMASMFTLSGISGIKIPDWDVGNVKDMSSMFVFGSITFDINQWDVSSVIDMSNMFFDCSIGQSLENWDVSSVIDMSNIFGDPSMTNDDYDKTLIGWSQLPSLQSGVQLDAPSKQYCLSEEARQSIIDIYGWTINDGGKAVDCEETECTSFTNIALNKIATQSSTYGDGVASIAIDGNTFGDSPWTADATLQHTISGEFQSWWQVDLGEISTIKGLNIFNRTDKLQGRLNNFYILISETPFSETATLSELLTDGTIFNYFFEGEAGLEENFDFETNGRYVRVQLSGIGTLHLAEVEVMGCAGELTQRPFVTTWKTDNPGESEDNQISIPTFDGETYDYFVDWGDGTTSENVTADITHSYAVPGSYTVSISGEFPRVYFNYYGDSNKLLSVDEWGSIKWSSMEDAFSGARNLDVIAEDVPDLSQVITTRNMFANCRNLKGTISFDNWDVSNIENMDSMFVWALLFNQQLSEWDVSNVENMNYMFGFNLEFNGDISNWNTPNVEIMAGMFDTANSFNQDIGNWNVSKVKDMSFMFLSSETFNQNISGWDVSNVTKMTETFQSAPLFDQDLSSWRVSNVTDMSRMFQSSGLSNENYDKTLIGWSLLPSLQNGVQLDAPSNQYCSSQEARQSIIDNYGWTINDGGKAIGCEETECTSFTNIALNKMATQSSTYGDGVASIAVDGNTFGDSPWTADATLQHTISGEFQPWWQVDLGETSAIKGITIFNRTDKLQARLNNFYILISETPFSETATLSELLVDDNILNYFFEGEAGLEDNVDFDTNGRYVRIQLSETGTLHMAEVEVLGCAGEAVPRPFVTTWKTDNPGLSEDNQITIPTFPGETYNYIVDWGDATTSENVTGDITHTYETPGTYTVSVSGDFPRIYFNAAFDVSINDSDKIIAVNSWGNNEWSSMQVAFSGCENLNVIADDVPNLSIANSTAAMFLGCSNLVGNLKFNEWNMSNIEEMQSMFNRAILFNQPLNNWNTEKALNINGMFAYAASFNQSINSWNIENVENIGVMFGFASSFNQSLQDWDTSSVTNMNGVFAEAITFNQSLENWDVSKVEDMSGILDLSGLSIANYDATLIGWSQLGSLQNDVVLGAFEKEYCLSEFARQNIIDNFGWIFNDGGKAVDCNPGGCLKPGNLAFGKPTEQSTTYGNGLSLYAVDGNIVGESPWSADLQHTISGESQSWWQVDLEDNFSIENMVIFNRSDKLQSRLNNFYVLISETPFSPTATLDELLTDENIEYIFFEGAAGLESEIAFETTGRYVRVQLSDVGTLHMAEVQVFGCSIAVPLTANLNEMNLYPNPANDYINVSFSEVAKVDVFYVYDISGRMIQSSKANANENNYLLNVTQLTTGTYFVKAIDNQGIEYYKQMVIKR